MIGIYTYIGLGAVIGFITFVGLLEFGGMGHILWRDGEFSPKSLWKYIKSPFFQEFLWYPKLWRHNWILMTGLGGGLGALYSHWLG
jgi:hypothetical protein